MSIASNPLKEKALVLRSIRHGESSRIITLFGETLGKFAVIAKGTRRVKRTIDGGTLEPPAIIEAVVYFKPSRNVQNIGQVSNIENFSHIKQDLDLSAYSAVILELINRAFTDAEPNPDVLELCIDTMRILEINNMHHRLTLWSFSLKLLKFIGFAFDPYACPVCNKSKAEIGSNNLFWIDAGGICCPKCRPEYGKSIPVGAESIRILRDTYSGSKLLNRIKPSGKAIIEITNLLNQFLKYHHPGIGKLKALEMLERLENPLH